MAHSAGAMSVMVDSADKSVDATPADGFSLSRWSRLKRAGGDANKTGPVSSAASTPELRVDSAKVSTAVPSAEVADAQVAPLPPLSSVSLTEDFTPFMQARVPQALRQQALKALFKEPHFNVMDRLDTYIDDYTQFEPISAEQMATLSSWKTIMNPPQQVVTPGGYAVDVESDEGKAVLAARDDAQTHAAQADDYEHAASAPEIGSAPPEPAVVQPAPGHPRYGKRVGDFAAMPLADVDALEAVEPDHSTAPTATIPTPEKHA